MRGSRVVLLVAALVLPAACTESAAPTSTSQGALPTVTDPPSLLPVLTDPPGTAAAPTAPHDALFGGDLCTALTADDFVGTSFTGHGAGRLTNTATPTGDACAYTVSFGAAPTPATAPPVSGSASTDTPVSATIDPATQVVVVVQAMTQADFDATPTTSAPSSTAPARVPLSGIGLDAAGVDHGSSYEVRVRVRNGWFSVTSTDEPSTRRLAIRAAQHAQPA